MSFHVSNPNLELSPLTGMDKTHYVAMARYVLERAFTNVETFESPLSYPIMPDGTSKTYPQPTDGPWRMASHMFECLERTFCLAGPLLHIDPDATVKGGTIGLRAYFLHHLYRTLTPGHPTSLPMPEDLPDATYQFTCEFGGLTKTLLLLPDVLWPHFTAQQRDAMAVTIHKWAHHRTTQNNWRIFNVLALSFLKKHGYAIDDELLKSHLLWIVSYHSGDGWYLEQTYNYYTISLFVVYCTIWCRAFGDEHYPAIADVIEASANQLLKTYCAFFARDGYINMWSRSICYRTWISGGFPVSFMLKTPSPLDAGWARRLCSGSLLQFVTRPEFFHNNVPSLGFYGPCEFVLQNYSCAGSPFLLFLPFICLALPDSSPFWSARENDGPWEKLGNGVITTVLERPGLVLVNRGQTGTAEIIPGKTYYEDPNYSKLAYSTHFPWEDNDPNGGTAMEYAFRSWDPRDTRGDDVNFYLTGQRVQNSAEQRNNFSTSQAMLYNGVERGVVYRQAIMRKPPNNGVGYIIDLADIIVPLGLIRVDRARLAFEYELTLGHFGLPTVGGVAATVHVHDPRSGKQVITAAIPGRQVALIVYRGWDTVRSRVHEGFNAEAPSSTVVYAHKLRRDAKNPSMELQICALLHKRDDSPWTEEQLSPIAALEVVDVMPSLSALGARITLADGTKVEVDFCNLDGKRMC